MMSCSVDGLTAKSKDLVLVDDDSEVLEIVRQNLQDTDWELACFLDAEEALPHLQQARLPDVLIVDNRMPRIDGVDVLEQLAQGADITLPRAYLCSGVAPPADILARVKRLGAGFLVKDTLFDKKKLLKALEPGSAA